MALRSKLQEAKMQERQLLRRLQHLKPHQFPTLQDFRNQKKRLQTEHKQATKRRIDLETAHDQNKRENRIARTKQFIQTNRHLLKIEANNIPLTIDPKTLTVRIRFSCGHKKTIPLNAFIPYESDRLWSDVIREGLSVQLSRNCKECFEQKEKKKVKWGIHEAKPVGHINVIIRGLH